MVNSRRGNEGSAEVQGEAASGGSGDARAVSWSPRRRDVPVGGGSTISKLMRREIGALNGRAPPRPDAVFCTEKFRCFKLKEEFLVNADIQATPWMIKSTALIIPANDFVFAIDRNGACVAFQHTTNDSIVPYKKGEDIWYFNHNGAKMECLFYNRINDSIITVSTSPLKSGYKMRAIPLENIRTHDHWGSGIKVFGSRTNIEPIFDSDNNLALISSHQRHGHVTTDIYETKNYELVHTFGGEFHYIATRPGKLIVGYKMFHNILPIEVFSTENWSVLKEFSYLPPSRRSLQFLDLCYENLLVKETDQNLHVIDLWNHDSVTTIENSEYEGPSSSFDLTANNVLLKFENDMVVACTTRGEQVRLQLGHARSGSNYSIFYMNVTDDKKFAIMYSRKYINNPGKETYNKQSSYIGAINVCSTFTGKCMVEINPCDLLDLRANTTHSDNEDGRTTGAQMSVHEAFNTVTALYYDEAHHIIYTANEKGFLHVWST